MAQYAIGDLQGCYDPFRRLLDKLKFDPQRDQLWLTGDLVNRGPKSRRTLRFVKSLGEAAITVLGNHDLHLLALANDIHATDAKFGSLWKILAGDDCDELIDWLRNKPLAHYDKSMNTLMIHAGVPAAWSIKKTLKMAAKVENALRADDYAEFLEKMYGQFPDRWSPTLKGMDKLRFTVNALTRMRMVDEDNRIDFTHSGPPDKADGNLLPWFAVRKPKWKGTRIVFGHWSALGLMVKKQFIAVDTGCVWERELTAVRIDKKKPIVTQVSCGC